MRRLEKHFLGSRRRGVVLVREREVVGENRERGGLNLRSVVEKWSSIFVSF